LGLLVIGWSLVPSFIVVLTAERRLPSVVMKQIWSAAIERCPVRADKAPYTGKSGSDRPWAAPAPKALLRRLTQLGQLSVDVLSAIIHCRPVSRGLIVRISAFGAPRVPWSDMKLSLRSAPLLTVARPSALRIFVAIVWRPVMQAIAEFGLVDEHGNGSRGPCSSDGLPEGHRQFAAQVPTVSMTVKLGTSATNSNTNKPNKDHPVPPRATQDQQSTTKRPVIFLGTPHALKLPGHVQPTMPNPS
jgi:hypothetical protein